MGPEPRDGKDVVLRLVKDGASDEEIHKTAEALRPDGSSAEQFIFEAISLDRDFGLHSQRVRWARRAAASDQLWALESLGLRWADWGSRGSLPWGEKESSNPEERVTAEEAQAWLARAAELGSRTGALNAAGWFPDDPRVIEWLLCAWGDGRSGQGIVEEDLPYVAYRLASALVERGDVEAGTWFLRALEGERWAHQEEPVPASWVTAVSDYCLWLHVHAADEDACLAWSLKLMEDAANHGPADRAYLESEYKTYRYEWQLTADEERFRSRLMFHLLGDHDLDDDQRREILLLVADAVTPFSPRGSTAGERLVEALEGTPITQEALLTPETAPLISAEEWCPITATFAWELTQWMIEDGVPAVFDAVGLTLHAEAYAALAPTDLREADIEEWQNELRDYDVWPECEPGRGYFSRDARSDDDWLGEIYVRSERERNAIEAVLRVAGLGAGSSAFRTQPPRGREDDVWSGGVGVMPDFASGLECHWRVLRRRPAWLGMYAAAASEGQAPAWALWWEIAGTHLAAAIRDSIVVMDNAVARRSTALDELEAGVRHTQQSIGIALRDSMLRFLESASDL